MVKGGESGGVLAPGNRWLAGGISLKPKQGYNSGRDSVSLLQKGLGEASCEALFLSFEKG
ncbi:protein of unknown function [Nitrospina watsonii]|uniref:Uncharacterized protein n=1 Tax=Nitrospina watsonii TaxID=1323948 RepID=A0ABM9HB78_9BACT|nr:protein of unknown function [Nitrospina watsonii]